jgi:hypothetical protein
LILHCYYEVIHLTIHTLQKPVSGLKSLTNVIIDFHLIFDDISKRGLIPIEILPITNLLAVAERKIGLVPPFIETLIRTKPARISNEIHILTDHGVIDTHMACLSALFKRHAGINNFEVIEFWIFKFFHEKINLGGEHIHLFKLVDLTGAGLSALINPTLTGGHHFN